MEENVRAKKANGGTLNGSWVPHDTRDAIVDYVQHWTERTELPARRLLRWLGLGPSKFRQRPRPGKRRQQARQALRQVA